MKELICILAAVAITVALVFLFGCATTQPKPEPVSCQCPAEFKTIVSYNGCTVRIPPGLLDDPESYWTDEELDEIVERAAEAADRETGL